MYPRWAASPYLLFHCCNSFMLVESVLDEGATWSKACSKSAAEMGRKFAGVACAAQTVKQNVPQAKMRDRHDDQRVCVCTFLAEVAIMTHAGQGKQAAYHVSSSGRHVGALVHEHAQHSGHGFTAPALAHY